MTAFGNRGPALTKSIPQLRSLAKKKGNHGHSRDNQPHFAFSQVSVWVSRHCPQTRPWLTMTAGSVAASPKAGGGGAVTVARALAQKRTHCSCFPKTTTLFLIRVVLLLPNGFPCNQGSITMACGPGKEMSSLTFILRVEASIHMVRACSTASVCGIKGRVGKTCPFSPKVLTPLMN